MDPQWTKIKFSRQASA